MTIQRGPNSGRRVSVNRVYALDNALTGSQPFVDDIHQKSTNILLADVKPDDAGPSW